MTRPTTSSTRVVRSVDLRRLHCLLLAVVVMEVIDLSIAIWNLIHG